MANTATLATLRSRVAANLDRSFSTTSFITTAQVNQWINDGLKEVHYLLASSGEDYFKSSGTVTLVGGTSSYALSAFTPAITDLYKIKGVDLTSGGQTYDVPRYMVGERNQFKGDVIIAGNVQRYMYRLNGNNIDLIPTPGAGTITVNYVPQFAKLANDGDLVSSAVPEGWEDFAVAHACARAIRKEESDPGAWEQEKGQLMGMMMKSLEPRDMAEPLRVVDVHGRWSRSSWRNDWGTR